MDERVRESIRRAHAALPADCRYAPATEAQLSAFEEAFGPIPADFRWFLAHCGGGVCGREWIDGIRQLVDSHRQFREQSGPGGWTMSGVFVIGWDGGGNPYGIDRDTGQILVEDHDFGDVHTMAESFEDFLVRGLLEPG